MHEQQTDDDRYTDAGQSAVLVLIIAASLGAALLMALLDFGGVTQDRARAQTAADAAALASLEGGSAAATEFARLHGGAIVSWIAGPGEHEVTVEVRVGDAVAIARASNAP